jgi:hemoglobin/transferrin/lactoferrin receptor protein
MVQKRFYLLRSIAFGIARGLLSLRYTVTIKGEREISQKLSSSKGALFLPNHPAEIDPILLMAYLGPKYFPRPMVVEHFYRLKGFQWILDLIGAMPIPTMEEKANVWRGKEVAKIFKDVLKSIESGDSFVIYPAGKLKSSGKELIGGASFVHSLLESSPDIDVVLIRTTGLWGSSFSRAHTGKSPDFGKTLFYAERIDGKDNKVTNTDYNKQVGSAYSQYDILQKFMYQKSIKVKHLVNLQYSNTSDVPRYDRLTEVSGTNPKYSEWYYGPEKRFLAAYHLELSEAKIYDKSIITAAFQDIEESRISRNFNNVNKKSQIENVKVFTLNADFQKIIKPNTIQYGAEMTFNDVKSTATNLNINTGVFTPSNTRYPDGKNTMKSLAVYLTNQLNVSQKLYINGGLRFNAIHLNAKFIDKTFFPFPYSEAKQSPNALSGNLGIVARPTNKTKLSALFSSGFRSPNIDDMTKVFDSKAGTLVVPNPDLKPEYTYNYEASINQQIGEVLTIEATYFYTLFKNAIITAPFTLKGQSLVDYLGVKSKVVASQNVREAQIKGWNITLYAKLRPDLIFSSTLNNTKGKIMDDKNTPLDHIPPMFGRTALKFSKKKLQLEVFSLYNGWKKITNYNLDGEDNQQYATPDGMPSWWTLNLRSEFHINKNLQIQVACENILDKNYRNFASGISNAGRNFIVTLRGNI